MVMRKIQYPENQLACKSVRERETRTGPRQPKPKHELEGSECTGFFKDLPVNVEKIVARDFGERLGKGETEKIENQFKEVPEWKQKDLWRVSCEKRPGGLGPRKASCSIDFTEPKGMLTAMRKEPDEVVEVIEEIKLGEKEGGV